jgi:hypothetical protein
MKKNKFDLRNIAERIVIEGTPAVERTIHREAYYLNAYPALLSLGDSATDDHSLLALELAVYGWLPTIMQVRPSAVFGTTTVKDARSARTLGDAVSVLEKLNEQGPSDHSWIAVSKVLHAINPRVFPILDRRVASAFGYAPWSLRRRQALIDFTVTMHNPPDEILPVVADAKERGRIAFGYTMTDIRALELILFALDQHA